MAYLYKCQSCKVLGELDEFESAVQCPQCGGNMMPVQDETGAETFTNDDLDAPTVAVPKEQIMNEIAQEQAALAAKRPVKVAKAIDLGFAGMLSKSSTGPYKRPMPQTAQQAVPQSPAQEEVAVETPQVPPTPAPVSSGQTTAGKKKFTLGKPGAPQRPAPAQPQAPPPPKPAAPMSATTQKKIVFQTNVRQSSVSIPPQPAPQQVQAPAPPPKPAAPMSVTTQKKIVFQTGGRQASAPAPQAAQPPQQIQRPPSQPQQRPAQFQQRPPQQPSPPPPRPAGQTSLAMKGKLITPGSRPGVPPQQQRPTQQFQTAASRQQPPPQTNEDAAIAAEKSRIEADEAARKEFILKEAQRIAEEQIRLAKEEAERKIAEEKARLAKKAAEDAELTRKIAEEAAKKAVQETSAFFSEKIILEKQKAEMEAEERIKKEMQKLEQMRKEFEQAKLEADAKPLPQPLPAIQPLDQKPPEQPPQPPALEPLLAKEEVKIESPPARKSPENDAGPSPETHVANPAADEKKSEQPPMESQPVSGQKEKPVEPERKNEADKKEEAPTILLTPAAADAGKLDMGKKDEPPAIGKAASENKSDSPAPQKKDGEAEKKEDIPELSLATTAKDLKPDEKKPEEKHAEDKTGKDEKAGDDKKEDAGKSKTPPDKKPLFPDKKRKGPAPLPGRKPLPASTTASAKAVKPDGEKKPDGNGNNVTATASGLKPKPENKNTLTATNITNSGLIKLKQKKSQIIYVVISVGSLAACIFIIWLGTQVRKYFERRSAARGDGEIVIKKIPSSKPIPVESKLKVEYQSVHDTVKRMPAGSKADIEKIIAEWDAFIAKFPDEQNDEYMKKAKVQRDTMVKMKEMF